MSRRSRFRTSLLSAGLFLSLTFLIAGGLGIRWQFSWVFKKFAVGVGSGSVYVTDFGGFELWPEARGLNVAVIPARLWIDYGFTPRLIPSTRETRFGVYSIPIWIPFVLVALPTVWVLRLDRRRPAPGACPCGYNLTGNTSGRCPECGAMLGCER